MRQKIFEAYGLSGPKKSDLFKRLWEAMQNEDIRKFVKTDICDNYGYDKDFWEWMNTPSEFKSARSRLDEPPAGSTVHQSNPYLVFNL